MSRAKGFLVGLLGIALWSGVGAAEAAPTTDVAVEPAAPRATALAAKPVMELGVEPARVALLTEHLDRGSQLAALEPFLPAAVGTLCAAGTVGLAAADTNEVHMSRPAMLLPTSLCAAASFGSYLLPREYQTRVATFSLLTSLSTLLAVQVLTVPDVSPAQQVTIVGFSSGGAAIGTLFLIDAALEHPVSWTTLVHDEAELRARGTSVSRADLQRIETDFRRHAVRPIPPWVYGLTQVVSGAVSLSPAFVPSTSREDKASAVAFGGMNLILGTTNLSIALLTTNPYERYEKGLAELRLSPVGPRGAAGLWASGAF
jgi:hypothetical protein